VIFTASHSRVFHLKENLPGARTALSNAATCNLKAGSQETGVGAHILRTSPLSPPHPPNARGWKETSLLQTPALGSAAVRTLEHTVPEGPVVTSRAPVQVGLGACRRKNLAVPAPPAPPGRVPVHRPNFPPSSRPPPSPARVRVPRPPPSSSPPPPPRADGGGGAAPPQPDGPGEQSGGSCSANFFGVCSALPEATTYKGGLVRSRETPRPLTSGSPSRRQRGFMRLAGSRPLARPPARRLRPFLPPSLPSRPQAGGRGAGARGRRGACREL
jgi:hypothetical protein